MDDLNQQMNIDKICQMTTSSEILNALHACRDKHPLNNPMAWRNAYCLAAQQKSYIISSEAVEWLYQAAERERLAEEMRADDEKNDALGGCSKHD